MGSKTKIKGIVLEDKEFEVFALIQNNVVEIELTEKQRYGLSLLGQTFIQFPPNTDKVQFEPYGKFDQYDDFDEDDEYEYEYK